jgi:hypothetical protein
VRKPCTNCYLTGFWAELKYADGRPANTDTGQWLHHIVLSSTARADARCSLSLTGMLGERFFASGNERTRARFPAGYGYPVGAIDTWNMVYELMNATMAPSSLIVEMTYEWVPTTMPGMKPLRPAWLDIGTCDNTARQAGTGAFQYTGSWTVNRPGNVVGIGGHLHDGGTHISLFNESNGELLCTMVAGYGGPGFEGMTGHQDHGDGGADPEGAPPTRHLATMSQCLAPSGDQPVARLALGDRVVLTAYYDTNRYPQHGTHPVMGIVILFVAAS